MMTLTARSRPKLKLRKQTLQHDHALVDLIEQIEIHDLGIFGETVQNSSDRYLIKELAERSMA